MKKQETTASETSQSQWRFRVGFILFVLGLISPLFIPLVTATGLPAEWKAVISGMLMLGIPELLWMAAVAVMGREGFNYIKGKIFGFLKKHAPPDRVSAPRYRVGLFMFLLPLLFGWLAPYGSHLIPGYEEHRLLVNVIGDLMLFSSLFMLGGEFWDKIRSLFVREAKIHFPK